MTDQQSVADDGDAPIPVSIVTGFLGSGKTTLLSRLVQRADMRQTALIINEFGEIGLDHDLVEKGDESVVQLTTGCLCCTVQSSLAETLTNLYIRRAKGEILPFRRAIVETTGLADPAPVLHALMSDPLVGARYRLDSVITTVDAVNGAGTLDRHFESVKQAAVADRLIITKTDIATAAATAALESRLRRLNPGAPIERISFGAVAPDFLFGATLFDPTTKTVDVQGWLRAEAYAAHEHAHGHGHDHHDHAGGQSPRDVNRHDAEIQAFCVVRDRPLKASAFNMFLDLLAANRGADLLRVKGILNIAELPEGGPVAIHGVQHVMHPPVQLDAWPSDDRRSRIVFITRNIGRDTVEKLMDALDEAVERAARRVSEGAEPRA
ncbi:MAG: GTP-binding protein [Alphaproteobacteria bacterium]|nr:GTP-binding protein [Alphaproteobacteria bacterium]